MTQNIIPVYQPSLSGREKEYVLECLDTNWISAKGRFVGEFEAQFALKIGSSYAATCSNGTVALHLALLSIGIGCGDEVLVPTFTYIASVNAICYVNATPVFVDSDPLTWQIDVEDLEKKITDRTKAIMVVHLYGQPANMDAIMKLASRHKLRVVEDCAEAFGSRYAGRHVGMFGDVATFSFFGNKSITTGEGGMVITNSKDIHCAVVKLKGQGLSDNRYYWHDVVGYNYRMTNICAAIGLAQLERADQIIQRKRQLNEIYTEHLKALPLHLSKEMSNSTHSFWMISILLDDRECRDPLMKFLLDRGIETRPFFYPVHKMPAYKKYNDDCLPVAENLAYRGLNLPSWPDLKNEEIVYICRQIKIFFKAA